MANILGISTGEIDLYRAQQALSDFYNDNKKHQIVTPNPEIILQAQKDEELFYILNSADLSLADGFGLKIAAKLSNQSLKRLTGADFLLHILQEAAKNKRRLLLINRRDGLSTEEDLKNTLEKQYSKINPLIISCAKNTKPSNEDLEKARAFRPDLAICGFGAPEQEKYLFHLQKNLEYLPVAIGLGGAFDFLSGRMKRAPAAWRHLGLEWFWRLIQQPSRWRRIWRATVSFILALIYWRFILPHRYRPNVAVMMYKKSDKGREIFIVERQDQPGHWQLPQGGLDGQNIIEAGTRELQEESGVKNFKIISSDRNLYRYDFCLDNGRDRRSGEIRHYGYKGQRQSLVIAEFQGKDEEIKINYWDHRAWRWIAEKDLLTSLHPCRQEAGKIYFQKIAKLNKN
jgi:N-acetylglucosaminyldiphosphoundecaprenol N-acetyl-beta-D-mannosaminyltransferase